MKISIQDLILGLIVILGGADIIGTGLWFSDAVNGISVIGLVLGAQLLTLGQIMTFRAVRKIHIKALSLTNNTEPLTEESTAI